MTPEETRYLRKGLDAELKAEFELRLTLAQVAGGTMRVR